MQPGDKPLTDSAYPGLRFKASASKKIWIYRYRSPVDGELRQIKLGNWPALPVHQAISAWEQLRDARDSGRDPAQEAREKKTSAAKERAQAKENKVRAAYTVELLCEDYVNNRVATKRKPDSVDDVRKVFKRIPPEFAALPADSITRMQAFGLIESIVPEAPTMASKMKSEMFGAWEYGLDSCRLPENTPNWWSHVLKGQIRSKGRQRGGEKKGKVERSLTPEEVRLLLPWLGNFSESVRDALTMYLWTGTRGAESTAMEGREITQEGDQWWWTIPKIKTKNARFDDATDLRVPLFGRALEVVLRRKGMYGDGFLFPGRKQGTHIQQHALTTDVYKRMPYCKPFEDKRGWKVDLPKCPVTHWTPHDLRRTARTFLSMLGCEFQLAETIIGHVIPGVAGAYDKYSYDPQRVEWLRKLSDYLDGLSA